MIADMEQKPKRGRPKKAASERKPNLNIAIDPQLLNALMSWCASQRVPPVETDVVRTAIMEFLQKEGAWPLDGTDKNAPEIPGRNLKPAGN
jgi:hypothetical protein